MIRLVALFAAVLVALWMPPALAATPVKVTADRFVVDEVKHQATFTGNVIVVRAGLTVWAEEVVVDYGAAGTDNIETFTATGKVRIKTPDQDATGDRAVFDPATQILRLTGNVQVVNVAGTLKGPELVIDLGKHTSVFSGSGGGRVTGVFTPQ